MMQKQSGSHLSIERFVVKLALVHFLLFPLLLQIQKATHVLEVIQVL